MNRFLTPLVLAGLAAFAAVPAPAQSLRYPVKSVDFDIWCTEIERLPWQRCDQRQPDDMAKFDAYRHTVERYEIEYLRNKETVLHFDEVIFNGDPVDKRPDSTLARPPSPVAGE